MKFLILFTPVLKFQRSDPSITKHFTKLVFISLFSHRLEKTHTIRETVKFVAETLAQFFVLCLFAPRKIEKVTIMNENRFCCAFGALLVRVQQEPPLLHLNWKLFNKQRSTQQKERTESWK
jgi:hypothetical protein